MESKNENIIIAVVAPSGAGKSTLMNYLVEKFPESFQRYPTVTSRPIRPGEEQGNPYYFVSSEQIEKMIADGDFLEYERKPYNNSVYGKTKSVLAKLDKTKILLTEEQIIQVQIFKDALPDYKIICVYIDLPDMEKLKERLVSRGDSPESIEMRIQTASLEEAESKHLADLIIPSIHGNVGESANILLDALKNKFGIEIQK